MKNIREKLRFLLTGLFGASLELCLFFVISASGVFYIFAHIIAFNVAVFTTFFLHYFFTYRRDTDRDNQLQTALLLYVTFMYVLLAAGSLVLFGLVELFGVTKILAKILQMLLIMPLSYLFQKYRIFK